MNLGGLGRRLISTHDFLIEFLLTFPDVSWLRWRTSTIAIVRLLWIAQWSCMDHHTWWQWWDLPLVLEELHKPLEDVHSVPFFLLLGGFLVFLVWAVISLSHWRSIKTDDTFHFLHIFAKLSRKIVPDLFCFRFKRLEHSKRTWIISSLFFDVVFESLLKLVNFTL